MSTPSSPLLSRDHASASDKLQLPTVEEEGRPRCRRRVVTILAVALAVGAVIWLHSSVVGALHELLRWCEDLGWAAAVVLGLGTGALNLFMLPTFPFMVGAGVLFTNMYGFYLGATVGVVCIFGGLWAGSMTAFHLGRTLWSEWASKELQQFAWFDVVESMIEHEGWWIVFLFRMSPLLPAEAFNYACSVTKLKLWQYGVGCLGSIVPVSFWVVTSAHATALASSGSSDGEEAARQSRRDNILLVVVNVVALGLLTGALFMAFNKYKARMKEHTLRQIQTLTSSLTEEEKAVLERSMTAALNRQMSTLHGSALHSLGSGFFRPHDCLTPRCRKDSFDLEVRSLTPVSSFSKEQKCMTASF